MERWMGVDGEMDGGVDGEMDGGVDGRGVIWKKYGKD